MHKIRLMLSNTVNLYLPNISSFRCVNYVNSISKRVRLCMITSQKCFCAKFSANTCTDEAKVKQNQRDEKLSHISNPICSVSYFTPCMINNSVFLQTYYNLKYLQSNSVNTTVSEDVSLRRTRKIMSPNFGRSEMASSSYRETNARLYKSRMDLSGNEFYPHTVSNIIDGLHYCFNTVHIEKTLFLNPLLNEKNYLLLQCSFAEYSQSWNRRINVKMPTTVDCSDLCISNSDIINKVPYELLKNTLSYTKRKQEKELCKKMAFKRTENISTSIAYYLGIKQKNISYVFSIDSLCAEINDMYEYPILKNCIHCKETVLLSKSFNSYLSLAKECDQISPLDCFAVSGSSVKTMNLNGDYQKMKNNLKKCNKLFSLCSGKIVHKKDYSQKTFKGNTYKNSKKGIMVGLLAGCCFSKESNEKEENSKLFKTMETSEVEDLYVEGETGVCTQKETNEILCEGRTSQSACEIINGSFTPEVKSEGIASSSRSVVRENTEEVIYGIQSNDSRSGNRNMFLQMSLPSTSFCSTEMFESVRAKMKRTSSLVDEPSLKLMKFGHNSEKNDLTSESETETRQTKAKNVGLYLTEKGKQIKSLQEESQLKDTVTPHARQTEADNDTESPNELLLAGNNKCTDGGCKRLKLSEDCFELKIDKTNEPCSSFTADNDEESTYNISSLFSEEQLQSKYGQEKSFPSKGADEGKSKKDLKTKPNYFVAIRVDNQQIFKALENIQNHITMQDKRLRPAMISLNTLHITLMVMHIDGPEELQRATEALKVSYDWINPIISNSPLNLQFQGLDHFGNKVLFAKLKSGSALDFLSDIAKKVWESFEAAGISSTDPRSFSPHLTLLKLSKSRALYKKGIKKIAPSLYSDFKDDLFGVQTAKGIQLLSMYKPKDPTGYYFCSEELIFGSPVKSLNESSMVASAEEKNNVRKTISSLVQTQLEKQSKSD